MQLYLVRHGETDWNILGKYQGWIDIPLNDKGLQQAQALKKAFASKTIHAIYCSDSTRAIQTASPIQEVTHISLAVDKRLREIHVGYYEGLTYEEIQKKYPNHPSDRLRSAQVPGGESFKEVRARVETLLKEIWQKYPIDAVIVIVTHGGVIREMLQGWNGDTRDERAFYPIYNTSITFVESHDGFVTAQIKDQNNITHLT